MNELELKEQNELVLKIHNDIDTAQDKLLSEAMIILKEMEVPKTTLSKMLRLKNLGFTKTTVVVETERKIEFSKEMLDRSNIINHYKKTYPFLKFLTVDEFDNICDKYNLIYSNVSNYIKDVPDDNILEIESCQKLKKSDIINHGYRYHMKYFDRVPNNARKWFDSQLFDKENYRDDELRDLCPITFDSGYIYDSNGVRAVKIDSNDLYIAAPKSHFDLSGVNQVSRFGYLKTEIEPKDPIVFRFVKGGLQILSKWGLEGDDLRLNTFGIN